MCAPHALLVAGAPAVGKSTLARRVVQLRPELALVDKDTLVSPLLGAAQELAGSERWDTHAAIYREHLRERCYDTVYDVAAEAARLGQVPVVVAPYAAALDEAGLAARVARRIGVGHAHLVWLRIGEESERRRRMLRRGAQRDQRALQQWVDRVEAGAVPAGEHLLVDADEYRMEGIDEVARRVIAHLELCEPRRQVSGEQV